MKLERVLYSLLFIATGAAFAFATNTTIGVTAGSGSLANLISFASTHVISEVGGCDATVENQCWAVDASGNLAVKVTNANANGQATMAGSSPVVIASNQSVGDPCMFQAKSNFAIATSSGNLQLVAGVAAKKVYICSFHVIAAAAAVISVIEGTGAACTTANEAAVWGSTTAASGESLAANGGMTYGDGQGTVGFTGTAANGLCLLQSGTTALAGNLTYIQQ